MIKQFKKEADSNRYNIGSLPIPKNYDPLKDENSFMNPVMLAYFWRKLRNEYSELGRSIDALRKEIGKPNAHAENIDRGQTNSERNTTIITVQRQDDRRQMIKTCIDDIELKGMQSEYGYCIDTGDAIDIERLMSEPTARRTIDAQEALERETKQYAALTN